jgi:hypothetical protein
MKLAHEELQRSKITTMVGGWAVCVFAKINVH